MMSVGSQYSMKGPTIPVVVASRGAAARSGISRMVRLISLNTTLLVPTPTITSICSMQE
jgi:hypothetical protein